VAPFSAAIVAPDSGLRPANANEPA
jgi:hypothetical protein